MKKYLIRIENGHTSEFITINGDSCRPFMIANNLWNYTTPGHAARRLEKLANCWESAGYDVTRIYGHIADMPVCGNSYNTEKILLDYSGNANTDDYIKLIKKHYHYL